MLRIGAIDQRETRRQELEMLLIERVLSGDVEAFYELVKPYEHMIYRSAALILHNETDAEDATQEAMYRAFANLARFRRECRFSTWIVRIAINEALMQLRRSRRIPYVGSLTHAG
jgi:RNA polymerase sigma-70 factor, ECF subfamily